MKTKTTEIPEDFAFDFEDKGTTKTDTKKVKNTEILLNFSANEKQSFLECFKKKKDIQGNLKTVCEPEDLMEFISSLGFYKYIDKETNGNSIKKLDNIIIQINNNIAFKYDVSSVEAYVGQFSEILDKKQKRAYNDSSYCVYKLKNILFSLKLHQRKIGYSKTDKSYNRLSVSNTPNAPNLAIEIKEGKINISPAKDLAFWDNDCLKDYKQNYISINETPPTVEELEGSDVAIFLKEITKRKTDADSYHAFQTFKSTIGYLAYPYKDAITAKAVILQDLDISFDGERNGGRGKNLFMEMFRYTNKVVFLRKEKKNSDFNYANVTKDTEIIFFPEIPKGFNMGEKFEDITGGYEIEGKGKNPILVDAKDTGKLCFALNHVIDNSDFSTSRRLHILEFSDSLQKEGNQTLYNILGKRRFFSDWDSHQWNLFYWFMFDCISSFQQNGLLEPNLINQKQRLLIQSTSSVFVEFIQTLEPNIWTSNEKLYKNYQSFSKDKVMTFDNFGKWLAKLSKVIPEKIKIQRKVLSSGSKSVMATYFEDKEEKVNDFLD